MKQICYYESMWRQLAFLAIVSLSAKLWTSIPTLSYYSLQMVAGLIVIYFVKSSLRKKKPIKNDQTINAAIITLSILLLILSTGGPSSPFFFLVYFLLFGISFIFQPRLTITYSFILVAIFSFQIESPQDFLSLISIIFVSPLAQLFGQQYLKNLADRKRIKIFKRKWIKSEKSLESQETNSLLWLALNLRNTLTEIGEITASLLSNLSKLSPVQKTEIKKIRSKTRQLLKESSLLKKMIDKETD